MLKPSNYNYNAVTRDMFTHLPTKQDYQTKNTIYGVYPCTGSICCINERSSRTISDLTNDERIQFKTIIAHMSEKAKDIYKISLAERNLKEIENLTVDDIIKNRLIQLPKLVIQELPSKGELYNAMNVLFALLIKESYNFTQPTRWAIIKFITLARLDPLLDKVQNKSTFAIGHAESFRGVYDSFQAASRCAFFDTSLEINESESYIPVFAFSAKDLKPLALSPELEAECPFND